MSIRIPTMILFALLTLISAFQPQPKTKAKVKKHLKDTVRLSDKNYDIVWDKMRIDFGKIKRHQPVKQKFTFTNRGRQPIVVTDVSWGYSGMLAEYPKEPVLPGKTACIDINFGAYNLGFFTKTFTVKTNGGVDQLTIKGEVFEPVSWDKISHDFGQVKQGEKPETIFTCKNGSDTLILENVLASCGCVVPEWNRSPIKPNDSTKIRVVFDTKGKLGTYTKLVTVYSNLGLFELTVKADIVK